MRPNVSKFKVWEEEVNQHGYFDNIADSKQFFEVHPTARDFEYLKESGITYAAHAEPNIGNRTGTLMREFEKRARTDTTDLGRIRWVLHTLGEFYAEGVENLVPENPTPGIGRTTFPIKLNVDWYRPGDGLVADFAKELPVIVTTEPLPDGYGYIYEVKMSTTNPNDYFDPELLAPGLRWMKVGSFIGEAQINRGSIQFGDGNSYIEFEVPMTKMGWEFTVTDEAHRLSKNLRFSPVANQGPGAPQVGGDVLLNSWETKFMAQTEFEKDYWLTYGRSSDRLLIDGVTRRHWQVGPGFFEFMEESNTMDYPLYGGSFEMFSDWLQAIWHDRVDPSMRNIEIWTGTGGLKTWQKWGDERFSGQRILKTADQFLSNEAPITPGRKGLGLNVHQWRTVYIEPFGSITINYLPILDNTVVNPVKDRKNLPLSSYEFLVFDYGIGEGPNGNICMLKRNNSEVYTYQCGTWTPAGPANQSTATRFPSVRKEKAFTLIHDVELGILVKDVNRMAWFRPNMAK